MGAHDSPFEVGQQVEARSFQEGFRGAWFRSKVKDVSCRKGWIGYVLEYLDFPDEKETWTKLYQKPPTSNIRRAKPKDLEIMIRPCFPPVYRESQMPNVNAISEVVVVVNDAWKVGEFVDWWKDDCYWSGRISQRLKDGKFQMDLLPPPLGEGLSYEVCYKDLRPSLDWSLETGWTVPNPMDSSNSQHCARIVKPFNKGLCVVGSSPSSKAHTGSENRERVERLAGASRSSGPSHVSSHTSKSANKLEDTEKHTLSAMGAEKEMHTSGTDMDLDVANDDAGGTSCSDSDSDLCSHAKAESIGMGDEASVGKDRIVNVEEMRGVSCSSSKPPNKLEEIKKQPLGVTTEKEMHTRGTKTDTNMENGGVVKTSSLANCSSSDIKAGSTSLEKDRLNDGRQLKKMRTDVNIPLNLMFSDTTEDAILDLEELVNRVRWMKNMLEIAKSLSNTTRPAWKFLGHLGSSTPK